MTLTDRAKELAREARDHCSSEEALQAAIERALLRFGVSIAQQCFRSSVKDIGRLREELRKELGKGRRGDERRPHAILASAAANGHEGR